MSEETRATVHAAIEHAHRRAEREGVKTVVYYLAGRDMYLVRPAHEDAPEGAQAVYSCLSSGERLRDLPPGADQRGRTPCKDR